MAKQKRQLIYSSLQKKKQGEVEDTAKKPKHSRASTKVCWVNVMHCDYLIVLLKWLGYCFYKIGRTEEERGVGKDIIHIAGRVPGLNHCALSYHLNCFAACRC